MALTHLLNVTVAVSVVRMHNFKLVENAFWMFKLMSICIYLNWKQPLCLTQLITVTMKLHDIDFKYLKSVNKTGGFFLKNLVKYIWIYTQSRKLESGCRCSKRKKSEHMHWRNYWKLFTHLNELCCSFLRQWWSLFGSVDDLNLFE